MGERDVLDDDDDRVGRHLQERPARLGDVGVTPFGTELGWLERLVRRIRRSR